MNCLACGAALPNNSTTCSHCGTLSPSDLLALGRHELGARSVGLRCPHAHGDLTTVHFSAAAGFDVALCHKCLGFFIREAAMQRLLICISEQVVMANHERLKSIREHLIPKFVNQREPCPRCGKTMQVDAHVADCPVPLHRCEKHGYWFEDGRIAALAEWYEAGGVHARYAGHAQRQALLEKMDENLPGDPPLPVGFWPSSFAGKALKLMQIGAVCLLAVLASGALYIMLRT
ncbi:hypothetical protein BH11PSE11_BH11PSE11_34510 [soil metagenome]